MPRSYGNACSRHVMQYFLSSTNEKELYLAVEFLHSTKTHQKFYRVDNSDNIIINFELHYKWKIPWEEIHYVIPLSIETLLHITHGCIGKAYGRERNVETRLTPNGDIIVRLVDRTNTKTNIETNKILLEKLWHERFRDLVSYILDDIDLMTPYIGIADNLREVKGERTIRRLSFAYIQDLHQQMSQNIRNRDMAAKALHNGSVHGFRNFLARCGLFYDDELEMKTIIWDEDEMVSSMIKTEIPPTAILFIHYSRCEKCCY